jgi:hypothetical protein
LKNEEKPAKTREQWVELRTQTERIEGIVHMPAGAKGRRISDFIMEADRGHTGMLHLTCATVFEVDSNRIKFHKQSLAVNKSMVLYAAPLSSKEMMTKRVYEPPIAGMSAN